MSVLVVTVTGYIELSHLRTAFAADGLRFAVLLRDEGLDTELTELEVGLDTEQSLAAADERTVQVHGHITRLDGLDDIVLFSFVVQFEVLLVEGEGCLGVVGEVEVHFGTHFSLDAGLYLLVEVEDVVIARAQSERRVRYVLVLESEQQFGGPLHLKLYTTRAEHFVCRADVELHVGNVELGLVVMLHLAYLLLPITVHDLPLRILVVLLLREHVGCGNIGVADTCVQHVGACLGLVLNGCGDVIRVAKVERGNGVVELIETLRA